MKHGITSFLVITMVLLLLPCCAHLIGAAYEPREHNHSMGASYTSDLVFMENSFIYFPSIYPDRISGQGFGWDVNIRVPFELAKQRIILFPIIGCEFRLVYPENLSDDTQLPNNNDDVDVFGFGVNIGGGFDFSFTPALFLRGKVFYQPDFAAIGTNYPGLRFNLGLGYRTKKESVRVSLAKEKAIRDKERKEQKKAQEMYIAYLEAEKAVMQEIAADPNNPQLYFEKGMYLRNNENTSRTVLVSTMFEKAAELDSTYRITTQNGYYLSPETASEIGINTDKNFTFNNFSLFYFLGSSYNSLATYTGNYSYKGVAEADKHDTLEKALAAYRRGYEIDIINGKNKSANLKAIYLGNIGRVLDLLGRRDEATSVFLNFYL